MCSSPLQEPLQVATLNVQPANVQRYVHIGLYEEFPTPERLAKLQQVDFPISLAVAAPSREVFLTLQTAIVQTYPQVRRLFFWPVLAREEGYYLGPFSDASAIERVAAEARDIPVLWDLELPLREVWFIRRGLANWRRSRRFTATWRREPPVHIWRSYAGLGLNPLVLRMLGMHYDPLDYANVSLHLDLYTTGRGRRRRDMQRILRLGVERYGARFIPALGVLDDGEGRARQFVPPATLRRDLQLVREAGVGEVWLFGVNGLNEAYLAAVRETLPLELLA
jgi:hypothetical protein